MNLLKRYGRQASVVLMVLGCLSLLAGVLGLGRSRSVLIWVENENRFAQGRIDNPIAANVLLDAGIRLYPQDDLSLYGVGIAADFRLPANDTVTLSFQSAFPVTLVRGSEEIRFYSAAATLGQALWEQGIVLSTGDLLSLPLATPLTEPLQVYLERGQNVTIVVGEQTIQVATAAKTVGAALQEAGVILQNLDYSLPGDDQPIPPNREIEVVRVHEETILEEEEIPFAVERVADAGMNMGEQKTLQSGQNGLSTSAVRIRYENDVEISRSAEYEWVSRQPVMQRTAYGTNVVVQKSPDGMVDYWLAKEVQVLSYRDTGQPTATGIWPYYVVIAVSPEWFSILRGSSIYVPGYGVGTVLDVCPGCSGKNWIDVFIPTEDYVAWNKTLTVYFLPPAPSNFSGDLP